MREIKFRFWSNYHKSYFPVLKIDFDTKMVFISPKQYVFFSDGVLEQYTGLKDKNGVEIYEGDLLGIVDDGDYIYPIEVLWDNEFSCVCYKQLGDEILPSFEFITKDYQVVGNIHTTTFTR